MRKLSPSQQRILDALRTTADMPPETRTRAALADRAFIASMYAVAVLRSLHEAGQIHIGAWVRPALHGPVTASYSIGPGKDAPKPSAPPKRSRTELPSAQRVLAWINAGNEGTVHEIAAACFLAVVTASNLITALHRAKMIRVAKYRRQACAGPIRVYGLVVPGEPFRNARRPKRRTVTEWRKDRRRDLAEQFGAEAAKKIARAMFQGEGTATVVIDGRPVYQRGVGMLEKVQPCG